MNRSKQTSFLKFIERENGLSLVQTMVAIGLSSFLGLGMFKIMTTFQRGEKKTKDHSEVAEITQTIIGLLKNSDSCQLNFAGKNPEEDQLLDFDTLKKYRNPVNGESQNIDLFKIDRNPHYDNPTKLIGGSKIKILSLKLDSRDSDVGFENQSANGTTHLIIQYQLREKDKNQQKRIVEEKIKLNVYTEKNGSGKRRIISCRTHPSHSMTGHWYVNENKHISYSLGDVFISKKLKGKDSIFKTNRISNVQEARTEKVQSMLHLIKASNDNLILCNQANPEAKGAIRNSSLGYLQFCDGQEWQNISFH